jgi:hypothetical protein
VFRDSKNEDKIRNSREVFSPYSVVHPIRVFTSVLEGLFPEGEAKLVALDTQGTGQLRRTAVEDSDLALVLLGYLLEDLVPVGTSSHGAGLKAGNQITLFLFVKKSQNRIEEN